MDVNKFYELVYKKFGSINSLAITVNIAPATIISAADRGFQTLTLEKFSRLCKALDLAGHDLVPSFYSAKLSEEILMKREELAALNLHITIKKREIEMGNNL